MHQSFVRSLLLFSCLRVSVVKLVMPDPPAEREPSAARNIYAFGLTSFLNDTASEMAYWVLPAFLASLGAGPAQLGLIEGVAESVASFAKLFSGYLTDRIDRRKPVVVAGYFVANAVKPLLAMVTRVAANSADSLYRPARQRCARSAARRDGRGVGAEEPAGRGLRADSIDGFRRSHRWSSGCAGPAGALWNPQRVLGCRGSGSVVRAGCAGGHS